MVNIWASKIYFFQQMGHNESTNDQYLVNKKPVFSQQNGNTWSTTIENSQNFKKNRKLFVQKNQFFF